MLFGSRTGQRQQQVPAGKTAGATRGQLERGLSAITVADANSFVN